MTLKVENIYKDMNLYIFIVIIGLFMYIKKFKKIREFIKDKYINCTLLLFITVLIWCNLKLGIVISIIYLNLIM